MGAEQSANWRPPDYAAAVAALPSVLSVTPVGSRATNTNNPLSDWDYAVETSNFAATARQLEALLERHPALAAQWDPFPTDATYMLLLPGATKVDFIFRGHPAATRGPWDPRTDAPAAIEAHFWDWLLWLGSKQLKGDTALVTDELAKMHSLLLGPIGAQDVPISLPAALSAFQAWRDREARDGTLPPASRLAEDILPRLRQSGVV